MKKIAVAILFGGEAVGQLGRSTVKVGRGGSGLVRVAHLRQLVHAFRMGHWLVVAADVPGAACRIAIAVVVVGTLQQINGKLR